MAQGAKKAKTAMEQEAYLLPPLEKVPTGKDVAQDCRLHAGSEASALAFGGCPVRRWRAERAVGERKRAPNTFSSSFRLEVGANFSGTCRACHRKGHSQCLAQVSDSQAAVEVA